MSQNGGDSPARLPKNIQKKATELGGKVMGVGHGGEQVSVKDLIAAKKLRREQAEERMNDLLHKK